MTVRKIGIARRGDIVVLQVDERTPMEALERLQEMHSKTGIFFVAVSGDRDIALAPPRRLWVGRKPRWMR